VTDIKLQERVDGLPLPGPFPISVLCAASDRGVFPRIRTLLLHLLASDDRTAPTNFSESGVPLAIVIVEHPEIVSEGSVKFVAWNPFMADMLVLEKSNELTDGLWL
jgi:hypothetical protein